MQLSRILLVSLLDLLTEGKSSLPNGTNIDLMVLPLFTGTMLLHTTAKKAASFSHSLRKIRWIPRLSVQTEDTIKQHQQF